jgi:hypothetical protein
VVEQERIVPLGGTHHHLPDSLNRVDQDRLDSTSAQVVPRTVGRNQDHVDRVSFLPAHRCPDLAPGARDEG